MDFLDILNGRYDSTHAGRYFERLPSTVAYPSTIEEVYALEEGQDFDYEIVDPMTSRYKMLISNLSDSEAADETIKTRDERAYEAKKHILLDDGRLMMITSVVVDATAAQKEAARLMAVPIGTEYILRLIEVENPWGLV